MNRPMSGSCIYVASTLLWGEPFHEIARQARERGYRGIELWAQQAFAFHWNPSLVRAAAEREGLELYVHAASWDLNFASLNEGIRAASIDQIIASLDFAAAVGAPEVTVHPPRPTFAAAYGTDGAFLDVARQSLRALVEAAEDRDVTPSLEIMENIPREVFTTPERILELAVEVFDRVAFTVDVAHCDSRDVLEHALHCVEPSKVHISNRCGSKLHTPLPVGDYDFNDIVLDLASRGLPMVVEGFDSGAGHTVFDQDSTFLEAMHDVQD